MGGMHACSKQKMPLHVAIDYLFRRTRFEDLHTISSECITFGNIITAVATPPLKSKTLELREIFGRTSLRRQILFMLIKQMVNPGLRPT